MEVTFLACVGFEQENTVAAPLEQVFWLPGLKGLSRRQAGTGAQETEEWSSSIKSCESHSSPPPPTSTAPCTSPSPHPIFRIVTSNFVWICFLKYNFGLKAHIWKVLTFVNLQKIPQLKHRFRQPQLQLAYPL